MVVNFRISLTGAAIARWAAHLACAKAAAAAAAGAGAACPPAPAPLLDARAVLAAAAAPGFLPTVESAMRALGISTVILYTTRPDGGGGGGGGGNPARDTYSGSPRAFFRALFHGREGLAACTARPGAGVDGAACAYVDVRPRARSSAGLLVCLLALLLAWLLAWLLVWLLAWLLA